MAPKMFQGINSNDLDVRYNSIKNLRELLSQQNYPLVDELVRHGVFPRMVEILSGLDLPDNGTEERKERREALQFEAAWVLTNIAFGTYGHTRLVAESDAFGLFVKLLSHPNLKLRSQSVWAIVNISGESPQYRDATLQHDVMRPLLETLVSEMQGNFPNDDLARNITRAISNLCRGKPSPSWDQIGVALPILAQLIHVDDEDLLEAATWAIAYMSDCCSRALEDIIRSGLIPRLVQLLQSSNLTIVSACVRVLGKTVAGDDSQTQVIIDAGALPALACLLASTSSSILRETCWVISNVIAGTVEQIHAVIEANLIPPIVRLLSSNYVSVKKEACWALCNATSVHQTHPEVVKYLVSQDCIKPLCDILTTENSEIVQVALEVLENILAAGQIEAKNKDDHQNPNALKVEEAQGLPLIYSLQQHADTSISLMAKAVITKHFNQEENNLNFVAGDKALPRASPTCSDVFRAYFKCL